MSKRTILIVDDNRINRMILGNMLLDEYEIVEAANGREAMELLGSRYAELSAVLLDIRMPEMNGYEVLSAVRASDQFADLPVMMITGSEGEESRIESLSLGANDYVTKPYNRDIILHTLRNHIAFREAAATVYALQRDKLTGVYNRAAFFEKAAALIAGQPAGYFVLGCVDIDQFKAVNDRFGSELGDHVLRALARGLQNSAQRVGGLCGRISGDQFLALYGASLTARGEVAPAKLRDVILRETGVAVTLSVGRYLVDDKSLSVSAMYDRAKLAQNTVKGRYDTHVAVFDESMRTAMLREQEIVTEMDNALRLGQFEVWYQPQYSLQGASPVGAEALVRWRHPTRGLLPPGLFIPVFEKNGFIYQLDRFVWEQTCRDLRRWLDSGFTPPPVSVNLSRYDLFRDGLVPALTELRERYAIPPSLLRLEVTESAFAEDTGRVTEIVKRCIDEGFVVEIDDFGSGYSSLNTLKDVPAEVLKMDMRFLESGGDSQRGGNILQSVVRMAKWIQMSVIAEGVETEEQAAFLASIGCDAAQGYLYARPMPPEDFESLVRREKPRELAPPIEMLVTINTGTFWDPHSMDTLIFNSYVGAACIFEYHAGQVELLRVSEKYARMIAIAEIKTENALRLDWASHLDREGKEQLDAALRQSAATSEEQCVELTLREIPHCPPRLVLRFHMRVIATAGARLLVYCIYENITAQVTLLERLRMSEEECAIALRQSGNLVYRYDPAAATLALVSELCPGEQKSFLLTDVPEGPIRDGRVSPATADAYRALFGAVRDGKPESHAVFDWQEDGVWLRIETRSTTVFSEDGTPARAVVTVREVVQPGEAQPGEAQPGEAQPGETQPF